VVSELDKQTKELLADKSAAFTLSRTGNISWRKDIIGRLASGESYLKPAIKLFSEEKYPTSEAKAKVETRLRQWLDALLGEHLKPLADLGNANDLEWQAGDMKDRLVENFGAIRRWKIANEVRQLDQPARATLRRYGVRFGAFNIYMPALLKPAAVEMLLILWGLKNNCLESMPQQPRAGLTSMAAETGVDEEFYKISGFQVCGKRVVRVDILERLGDMIRPLASWRYDPVSNSPKPQSASGDGGFLVNADMMSIMGCSATELAEVLRSIGFVMEKRTQHPDEATIAAERLSQAAFRALEDYVAINKPEPDQTVEAPELPLEEVWYFKRRNKGYGKHKRNFQHNNKPQARQAKQKRGPKDKGKTRQKPKSSNKNKKERRPDPDSPFAVLAELTKFNLK
jgi:ATP-dependent RNA helicase SUPV3L1/SUV3